MVQGTYCVCCGAPLDSQTGYAYVDTCASPSKEVWWHGHLCTMSWQPQLPADWVLHVAPLQDT